MFLLCAAEDLALPESATEEDLDALEAELDEAKEDKSRSGPYWNKIRATLLKHSSSDDVEEAIKEWKFVRSWIAMGHCELCGKNPIKYHYQIENRIKGTTLAVGSECIWQYLLIPGAPDKQTLKKRLGQQRSKLKAIALGKAKPEELALLDEVQSMERDLNMLIARIARPEKDVDIRELERTLYEPVSIGRVLKISGAVFGTAAQAQADLSSFRYWLDGIGKRSTKYKPYGLLSAVLAIMNFRSGLPDQKRKLEALRRNIDKCFAAGSAKDIASMAWAEIGNARNNVLNKLNEGLDRAKVDCQARYNDTLGTVRGYEHLTFLLQAGIDSNKAQMDKVAADARKLIESDDFLEKLQGGGMQYVNTVIHPTFVTALSTGDSRIEDAAYHAARFIQEARTGNLRLVEYAVLAVWGLSGGVRDYTGMRKALLRAGDDSLINIEQAGDAAVQEVAAGLREGKDALKAIFQEEVDDVKMAVKQAQSQKVYEAMSDAWGFDVRKFFSAVPYDHPYFPSFCGQMLRSFTQGRMEPTFKERASIDKNMAKYKTPVPNSCWDKMESALTKPFTPSYGR